MRKRHLNLPYEWYDDLLYKRCLTNDIKEPLYNLTKGLPPKKIVIFGKALTGQLIRETISEKFDRFITSENLASLPDLKHRMIIVATSPIHYQEILFSLKDKIPADTPVVTLFDSYRSPVISKKTNERQAGIVVFTVHKAASMFLHHLTQKTTRYAGIPYYSQYNGNLNFGDAPGKGCGCWGPYRTIVPSSEDSDIVLHLRDPRDILTSMFFSYVYSHDKSVKGFNPTIDQQKQWETMGIDWFVLQRSPALEHTYNAYCESLVSRPNVTLLKYEDMILDFNSWLTKFVNVFPIKERQPFCDNLYHRFYKDISIPEGVENVYQHKRQLKPGDFNRKLRKRTIEKLNQRFSKILTYLKYD